MMPKAPTGNAFCATGEGGGVDPSCGAGSDIAGADDPHEVAWEKLKTDYKTLTFPEIDKLVDDHIAPLPLKVLKEFAKKVEWVSPQGTKKQVVDNFRSAIKEMKVSYQRTRFEFGKSGE
jgi:hypothetical protein